MLTERQREGVRRIKHWFRKGTKQMFILAGYAGTGKSYLTNFAIDELGLRKDEVVFCTFTGKASLVLMKYHDGKTNVGTIHKTIYDVKEDKRTGEIYFILKDSLPGVKLVVVDEISMVNQDLLDDLSSFGIPILGIGDHGQLPPIGKKTNVLSNPDYILTEIMRQAENNPIIYLSMMAREGKEIRPGKYGNEVIVLSKLDNRVNVDLMLRADQVICGYNSTRIEFNQYLREAKGFQSDLPEYGDKVIFLENNWSRWLDGYNIVNGMIGYVRNEPRVFYHHEAKMRVVELCVQPDFLDGVFENIYVPVEDFYGQKIDLKGWQRKYVDRMTFGDVITCHKAQGSQWDKVFIWNEPFGDEPWRWTYTAITRAKERLVLAV